MKAPEMKQQIALKNILFATDFEASAGRALPFAIALADRYGAKFYAAGRYWDGDVTDVLMEFVRNHT